MSNERTLFAAISANDVEIREKKLKLHETARKKRKDRQVTYESVIFKRKSFGGRRSPFTEGAITTTNVLRCPWGVQQSYVR